MLYHTKKMTVLQEFSKAVQWTQEWNKWTKGILCQRDWNTKKESNRNSAAEEYNEIKHNEDSINRQILLSKSKHLGTWKQVF